MGFVKVQAQLQSNKNDNGPSFSLALKLSQPQSHSPIAATTSMADTSTDVEWDKHYLEVMMDYEK